MNGLINRTQVLTGRVGIRGKRRRIEVAAIVRDALNFVWKIIRIEAAGEQILCDYGAHLQVLVHPGTISHQLKFKEVGLVDDTKLQEQGLLSSGSNTQIGPWRATATSRGRRLNPLEVLDIAPCRIEEIGRELRRCN